MSVDLAASFSRESRRTLHMFGGWPPGNEIKVGTFGTLNGDLFQPLGHISDLGIPMSTRSGGPKLLFEFMSAGVKHANVTLAGEGRTVAGKSRVSSSLTFAESGSVYFRTSDALYSSIDKIIETNKGIMEAFERGSWLGHYVVVHGVFTSGRTTIIVSSENNAEIEFEGSASGVLDLTDVNADISLKSEKSIAFKVVAKPGLVPLISLSQIRPRNKWLALLGFSEQTVTSFFAASPDAVGDRTPDNLLAQLAPVSSSERAAELNLSPQELFQIVELDGAPSIASLATVAGAGALPTSGSSSSAMLDFYETLNTLVAHGSIKPHEVPLFTANFLFFQQNRNRIRTTFTSRSWVGALNRALYNAPSLPALEAQVAGLPGASYIYMEQLS